jgi:hypothetical protein
MLDLVYRERHDEKEQKSFINLCIFTLISSQNQKFLFTKFFEKIKRKKLEDFYIKRIEAFVKSHH